MCAVLNVLMQFIRRHKVDLQAAFFAGYVSDLKPIVDRASDAGAVYFL